MVHPPSRSHLRRFLGAAPVVALCLWLGACRAEDAVSTARGGSATAPPPGGGPAAPAAGGGPAAPPSWPEPDDAVLEQLASTLNFNLGTPAGPWLSPDGAEVVFRRSGPRSFVGDLYAFDV